MAARVAASEVKEVIDTDLTDARVDVHIGMASRVVDRLSHDCLTADILKDIETWLAAHYVSITDPKGRVYRRRLGDGEEHYFTAPFSYGKYLEQTMYGQAAITADCSGQLRKLVGKLPATVETITDED